MNRNIENNFNYHKPTPDKAEIIERLRSTAKSMAYMIDELCPAGREKSLATTKLEEALMWANAAVARDLTQAELAQEGRANV